MVRWEQFRAIAARLGLSREKIEEVERGGVPTVVKVPINPIIGIRVRPDPDWTERLGDAWHGKLVNSRQEQAGAVPVADDRLHIGAPDAPENGITVHVMPGEYEVVLTIAHEGDEAEGDYEQKVSHVWAMLRGADGFSIEPLTDANREEVGVETSLMAISGVGVSERLAAEHVDGRVWALSQFLIGVMHRGDQAKHHWARVATADASGAMIAVSAALGRNDYPIYRIDDADGNIVGVLADFYYDNRPWDSSWDTNA